MGQFSRAGGGGAGGGPEDPLKAISHHRHWQRVMRKISGMKISTLPSALPAAGSVLGGVLELRGNHISVAWDGLLIPHLNFDHGILISGKKCLSR